ncbi:MAG: WbqC family protein [Ignavibacterium sp.]|nr:WbqC family protein [Ignavibacterium sp.]
MIVAIHQPNFLPWIGFFNKIKNSDLFVFLDDVQFERGKTFTSRTRILINGQENWLTVPVVNKSELIAIKDIKVDKSFIWKHKHLRTLELNYKKHPYFNEVFKILEDIYKNETVFLIDYNISFILRICDYLDIRKKIINSSDIEGVTDKNSWEKLLYILIKTEAKIYLSGSGEGSKRYVNESDLRKNDISLLWQDYNMQTYIQKNSRDFVSHLSIIDLLFNYGKNATRFI